MAHTWWIKVPSHMGTEGNEQADRLAKERVKKHGVRLVEESRHEGPSSYKRNREEEEQMEVSKGRHTEGRYRVQEAGMPKAKRERISAVQGLIDLGPLLPRLGIPVPSQLFKAT